MSDQPKQLKPRTRRIGSLLVLYRAMKQIGVREMAREIGISAATASRIERGHKMDADTLLKMWAWLNSESLPPQARGAQR